MQVRNISEDTLKRIEAESIENIKNVPRWRREKDNQCYIACTNLQPIYFALMDILRPVRRSNSAPVQRFNFQI